MKKRYVFLLLAVCAALLLFPASADELKLPSELKEIGEEAFMGDQGLDTVILPEQLSTIGARAFAGSSLKEIVLPDALTSIADDAFSGCVNLTVRASEGSYAYCWAVQNGYIHVEPAAPGDFEYWLNTSAHTASITKYIGGGGYVVIPEKIENCDVVSIAWQAFAETAVTGVVVPETVKSIDGMAFSDCKSLVSVILPSAMDSLDILVFSNCGKLLSVRIPDGIQEISYCLFINCDSLITVQVPDSVTSIGTQAFYSCESLSSLLLPKSVTFIGSSAFAGCTNLEEINVPAGLTAIPDSFVYKCSKLKQLVIPEGITSIGSQAFYSCESLSSVLLPNSVTSIGSSAFAGCTNLEEINVPAGLTAIPDSFVYKCSKLKQLVIPEGIASIGTQAFYSCESLSSLLLPNSVTSIGSGAFAGCTNLEEINVPTGLTAIPDSFVYKCSKLKQLVIPEGITSIGAYAFDSCKSLSNISLPNSVTSIGSGAFARCTNLEEINVPTGLTAIPDSFVYNCSKLKQLVIPEGITSIGKWAFGWCSNLEEINVPTGLTAIPEFFVYHCSMLKQLVIPEGVTSIGKNAFDWCESLSSLSLPAGITNIPSEAFTEFSGILHFSGNAPSIADDAFGSNSRIIIIYPHDKTGWSEVIGKSYGARWLYWQADNAQSETPETEKDASETLQGAVTNNEGKNEYATVWECGVSSSYLTRESDGTYTRVEYANNTVYIEQYNSSLQLTWKKSLSPELPVWGGYFAGTDSNFLFFGQNNDEMDDAKEVIRVVRYTKNWNRDGSMSIRAANTKNPFAFGTMNCTQSDDILYLHTSRVMYNGHQSNLNFKIFIPTMERLEQSSVYVSHSFNQYVIEDEGNIIWLNHGDAYPRALLLTVENNSAGAPKEGNKTSVTLMEFGGSLESELYQNTYATVGGLECSGTHYLAVGKSIDQSQYGTAKRQNIYVISADKNNLTSDGVTMRWLTSYPESDTRYVSNPQFVRISGTKFLILWTEAETSYSSDKEVHYVFLNGQGMPVSQEYTAKGKLSDCQPIVSGNKVLWYVTNNSASVFYSIDLDNPGTLTIQ